MSDSIYDPFVSGPYGVGVQTVEARDAEREREFPCEIWFPAQTEGAATRGESEHRDAPAQPGIYPLILYSHSSGGNRRSSSFLCRHLAGHGYVVAALDHSEVVDPELGRRGPDGDDSREARVKAFIANRVPDLRFLLDFVLDTQAAGNLLELQLDTSRIGLAGHSAGGWNVLATADVDPRVRSVVAMVPGGSSRPRPGILRVPLDFAWGEDVPVLFLAGGEDVMIPVDRVAELYDKTPGNKRMFILDRADHQHFVDDVEGEHEALRAMSLPGDAAWIPGAMRPIQDLASREQAHLFVRGLTLAHFDATLRQSAAARAFLEGDVVAELAGRGVEATVHQA